MSKVSYKDSFLGSSIDRFRKQMKKAVMKKAILHTTILMHIKVR